ncbi:MAG TPA: TolC family protein [Paludibaculum sp.]
MNTRIPALVLAMASAQAILSAQTPALSITIDQAVQEALGNNFDLLAERQNIPIARAKEIQAALRPNPTASFTWDYMDWLRRGLSVDNSAGPSEWTPQFNYIWETAGKRSKRMTVAQLATSVSEARLLDSVRQLSLAVRLGCVDFLLAKENVDLARQNLKVFDGIVEVNGAKVKAGDLAGVELIRARVAQQQIQTAVQQAELRLQTARNNLQQLLGRSTKTASFDLTGSLSAEPAVLVLDELKTAAIQQRPDLLALRKDAERSQADTRLQVAVAKPDVTTGLLYHHQYGYSNGRTFGAVVTTELPIYERNQGEIARATRETRQIELRTRALESAVATEVENTWQQYTSAKNLLERIRSTLLTEARSVRDITEFSYRRGEASLLEFLDAQRAYNDAMQSYNDARADHMKSLYLIDAVTGKPVTP